MLPPVQSFLNNGSRWRKGSKETTSVQGNHDWLEQKYLDGERRPAGVVSPDCFQHVEKKSQELPAAKDQKCYQRATFLQSRSNLVRNWNNSTENPEKSSQKWTNWSTLSTKNGSAFQDSVPEFTSIMRKNKLYTSGDLFYPQPEVFLQICWLVCFLKVALTRLPGLILQPVFQSTSKRIQGHRNIQRGSAGASFS